MRRLLTAVASGIVLLALAGCVPESGEAPAPAEVTAQSAPAVRVPTLAEFVTTMRVYDEPTVKYARGDAVDDLVGLVFGDLGPGAVECVDRIIDRESSRQWGAMNTEGSGAGGLTQLLGHADLAEQLTGSRDVLNPFVNLVVARQLWPGRAHHWAPSPC